MTREEFRKQLGQLRESLNRGLSYYAVWKGLRLREESSARWSLEDQNKVLGQFRGFFTPVVFAFLDMALMQFAKIFDTHARTASLTNLLAAARRDASLVPHASASDLSKISRQVKQSDRLLKTLKQKRDQDLAHVDANPAPVRPLLTRDFDKLVDWVNSAFETLSVGHDQNVFSSGYLVETSAQHTAAVLDILLKDIGRHQKEYEEEMVRIGLDEMRRMENVIGRRLNERDMRSMQQSYGFTEEQMQRIEKAYTSDKTASVQS